MDGNATLDASSSDASEEEASEEEASKEEASKEGKEESHIVIMPYCPKKFMTYVKKQHLR